MNKLNILMCCSLLLMGTACNGGSSNDEDAGDVAQEDAQDTAQEDTAPDPTQEDMPAEDTAPDPEQEDTDPDPVEDPVEDPLPDEESDPLSDPMQDSEEDPVPDTVEDAADMVDEDTTTVPKPITFIVRNSSGDTVYFDWTFNGQNKVSGERKPGEGWEDINYWRPNCMADCADYDPGEGCCMACLPPPSVKELADGGELEFEWDGEYVYTFDDDHCGMCTCFRRTDTAAMSHRATACAYFSFACWDEPCSPSVEGVYTDANVTGEPACPVTEFDIPYAGDEVYVIIE